MTDTNIECPECNGYGSLQFCGGIECDTCNGTGLINQEAYNTIMVKRDKFVQLVQQHLTTQKSCSDCSLTESFQPCEACENGDVQFRKSK